MSKLTTNLEEWLVNCQSRLNHFLEQQLPSVTTPPHELHQALRYVALDGGKRLRPLLVYATGLSLNAHIDALDAAAAAIELIHCYSLVHDDLPAMDDDDLRRGKPSCHKAFNEAIAILAGDALQTLAFQVLAQQSHPRCREAISTLAQASGVNGMVGGQALDLANENQNSSLESIQQMHALKTGALFRAAIRLGFLMSPCNDTLVAQRLDQFAEQLGLCFQIQDDILDVESSTEVLGKTVGKDQTQHKASYVNVLGLAGAKSALHRHHQQCEVHLNALSREFKNNYLKMLVERCVFRNQ